MAKKKAAKKKATAKKTAKAKGLSPVEIHGDCFQAGATATFGDIGDGTQYNYAHVPDYITCMPPTPGQGIQLPHTVNVTVTNPDGQTSPPCVNGFTYEAADPPRVDFVDPDGEQP